MEIFMLGALMLAAAVTVFAVIKRPVHAPVKIKRLSDK